MIKPPTHPGGWCYPTLWLYHTSLWYILERTAEEVPNEWIPCTHRDNHSSQPTESLLPWVFSGDLWNAINFGTSHLKRQHFWHAMKVRLYSRNHFCNLLYDLPSRGCCNQLLTIANLSVKKDPIQQILGSMHSQRNHLTPWIMAAYAADALGGHQLTECFSNNSWHNSDLF